MLRDYFSDPQADRDAELERDIEDALGWAGSYAVTGLADNQPSADMRAQFPNETSEWMDKWLRRHTPMRDRVFRNTRKTMREYQAAGIIPESVVIPHRHVDDEFIPLAPNERHLYERIEEYIRRHYNAYKNDQGNKALGFIMTVYRRRLTSSFEAIKRSLQRRLNVLEEGRSLGELLTDDDNFDVEDSLFDPEAFDVSLGPAARRNRRTPVLPRRTRHHHRRGHQGQPPRAGHQPGSAHLLVGRRVHPVRRHDGLRPRAAHRRWLPETRLLLRPWRRGLRRHNEDLDRRSPRPTSRRSSASGELEVLIGTDSMSEGLNLQTSGRLINYDMPWNLMRVEQRIGRVDRIGASYKDIRISNYFYADTVEEQVYKGIAEDYGDFTNIVGDAAPVLANVEKAIEQLALTGHVTVEDIANEVENIRDQVEDIKNQPVQNNDMGAPVDAAHISEPPSLVGGVTPADLELSLSSNGLTTHWLEPDSERPKVYGLTLPPGNTSSLSFTAEDGVAVAQDYLRSSAAVTVPVTFDRETWDESDDASLVFLTFGTPELAALLPARDDDA